MKGFVTAAAALSLGSTVLATTSECPDTDLCYSLSIPDTTASSGNGDIYFQISAPTSYEWVALGQGSSMTGANMFVMYQSSDGTNVTVSPRLGTGHVEPEHDTAAKITLLDGSGVSNGKMIANVLCSNCESWSGGSADFSSSSTSWIYAALSGTPIKSDSLTQGISQHSTEGTFSFSSSEAKGGDANTNPFEGTSGGSSGGSSGGIPATCTPIGSGSSATATANPAASGCPTTLPATFPASRPAWVTSCFPSGFPAGAHPTGPPKVKRDDGCPAGYESTGASSGADGSNSFEGDGFSSITQQQRLVLAHGVLASLAFVGLFPIGGILIRLASFTGLIWVHAAFQMFAYLIYIVAFAMGIYIAKNLNYLNETHTIIGIVLFIVLFTQPIAGWMHHRMFKKYQRRTFWSYLHLFHGRGAILLGMVNGGLGIKLAGTTGRGGIIAYAVITAIMGLVYIAAIIMGELRRKRNAPPTYEKSERARSHSGSHRLRDLSSEEAGARREYYAKRNSRRSSTGHRSSGSGHRSSRH